MTEKTEAQCFQGQTVVHVVKEGEERWECHDIQREMDTPTAMLLSIFALICFSIIAKLFVEWRHN